MTSVGNRGMGWLPDVPSMKDYTKDNPKVDELLKRTALKSTAGGGPSQTVRAHGSGAGAATARAVGLAPSVDLRAFCSPIVDQGPLGSCTANAAAGLVEYFEKRSFGRYISASRLFIYKTTRDLLGVTGDTGAYLRSTMGALALFGAPPEQYLPYNVNTFDAEPSAFCYAFGANYQALQYFRLDAAGLTGDQVLQSIKTFLDGGFPSMFGFPVYDEYMHLPANGLAAYPSANSTLYGGHANDAVGYDDNLMIGPDKGALLVRNSWGTGWGLNGYAWLSYKYVTEQLAVDWWSIVQSRWIDTGKFGESAA
jgi:C1A family cysteine protease